MLKILKKKMGIKRVVFQISWQAFFSFIKLFQVVIQNILWIPK